MIYMIKEFKHQLWTSHLKTSINVSASMFAMILSQGWMRKGGSRAPMRELYPTSRWNSSEKPWHQEGCPQSGRKNSQNAPFVRFVSARALNTRRMRFHDKSFSSAQENLETTPTTMGWDRRKATLGFGGCPHFPYLKKRSFRSEESKRNQML